MSYPLSRKSSRTLRYPLSRRLTALTALLAAVLALALTACTAPLDEPATDAARPVTTEEAQLLAIARFNNFDAGSRPFTTNIQERGVDLRIQGWVDYASQLGYAATTGAFPAQAMLWTSSAVGIIAQEPDAAGDPALPIPSFTDPAASLDNLDPASSRLDALLAIISGLGSDRPDNPLLVQQAGALWLRADEINGSPVTVFASPPSDSPRDASSPPLNADTSALRLWVDATGVLRRAEARIGDDWTTIDFSDEQGQALALPDETQP
ncbi:hypothetical protein GCM10022381_42070 [Leifsonia kafniensis]|uniref:LppX_LprAFG lipoprotein n=1 Tax=Leifsonia kafniensis TaxID=475957 RepID=A0ABP7L9I4_9MICO